MNSLRLYLYLFGTFAYFVAVNVCREAIVGGEKAAVDQFPYQVTLLEYEHDRCGAGIIADEFILTAAHCILEEDGQFTKANISILARTNQLDKRDKPAVIVDVKKIYIPKEFNINDEKYVGDIAVLKLKQRLELSKHIRRLELPKKQKTYDGKTGKIAGFGWDWIKLLENNMMMGHNTDNWLRFVKTDVLKQGQKGYDNATVAEKQICAKAKKSRFVNQDVGVCYGDSGSLLVYKHNIVIGILSTSPGSCSEKDVGAIYTRVSHYMRFIENAMQDKQQNDIRTHDFH